MMRFRPDIGVFYAVGAVAICLIGISFPIRAVAQVDGAAGPSVPPVERRTEAERAIGRYDAIAGPRLAARPCRPGTGGDIVVCAPATPESSPYRLPLPGEAGPVIDDRRRVRDRPVSSGAGRAGIAPMVTFGLKKVLKF